MVKPPDVAELRKTIKVFICNIFICNVLLYLYLVPYVWRILLYLLIRLKSIHSENVSNMGNITYSMHMLQGKRAGNRILYILYVECIMYIVIIKSLTMN